jgi:hypothetical protein
MRHDLVFCWYFFVSEVFLCVPIAPLCFVVVVVFLWLFFFFFSLVDIFRTKKAIHPQQTINIICILNSGVFLCVSIFLSLSILLILSLAMFYFSYMWRILTRSQLTKITRMLRQNGHSTKRKEEKKKKRVQGDSEGIYFVGFCVLTTAICTLMASILAFCHWTLAQLKWAWFYSVIYCCRNKQRIRGLNYVFLTRGLVGW